MILTNRGLPNSCASCGATIDASQGWFAEHEDAARSGNGHCAECEAKRVAAENDAPLPVADPFSPAFAVISDAPAEPAETEPIPPAKPKGKAKTAKAK